MKFACRFATLAFTLTTILFLLACKFKSSSNDYELLRRNEKSILETLNIPQNKKPLPSSKCYSNPMEDQFNATKRDSRETYEHIFHMCAAYTDKDYESCDVPNVVHLVPGKKFKFHHYLNLKAIQKILKPDRIYVHGEIFPFHSRFFMKAIQEFDIELVISRTFSTTFSGIYIRNGEHKADIIRMEALINYGGIYLDMDAYPIKPFTRFMKDEFSIGYQNEEQNYGLNNGIMIGKKCARYSGINIRFLLRWYNEYRTFDPEDWDHHSVRLPLRLYEKDIKGSKAKAYKKELVSWWAFDGNVSNQPMFKPYKKWDWWNVYAIHSFYRAYEGTTSFPIDFETVKTLDNSFGRFARHVLYDGPPM